ncbi:MAG TPA: NAD-binding protein [Acidimicrobiia bacterium]|nr:NAD-binding protein [Acidimicrobiia bacterium]
MTTSVLIVGGGKVGSRLAGLLTEGGHEVRVVESDPVKAGSLSERGEVIEGSGTDARVLERAGIRSVEVVAAVTGTDETNLVIASLAHFEFHIPRVIARIVDPRNAWLFKPDMGVDVALDQADLLAHLVAEEMSLGEMTTLLKLKRGQYSLVEETVSAGAPAVGQAVSELELADECVIVAVIRDGDLLAGHGRLMIEEGDEVLAVVHSDAVGGLADALGRAERTD